MSPLAPQCLFFCSVSQCCTVTATLALEAGVYWIAALLRGEKEICQPSRSAIGPMGAENALHRIFAQMEIYANFICRA
jgi:hypothetical protein